MKSEELINVDHIVRVSSLNGKSSPAVIYLLGYTHKDGSSRGVQTDDSYDQVLEKIAVSLKNEK